MGVVEMGIAVQADFARRTSVSPLGAFPMRGVRSVSAARIVEWASFVTLVGAVPSAVGRVLARQVERVTSGRVNAREGPRRSAMQVRLQMTLEVLRTLAW